MNAQHLITASAPIDHARALRAMAAWWHNDKLGVDVVMHEVATDRRPDAAAGMLFAVLAQTSQVIDLSDDPARLVQIFTEKVADLTLADPPA